MTQTLANGKKKLNVLLFAGVLDLIAHSFTSFCSSQVGFIDFLVKPIFEAWNAYINNQRTQAMLVNLNSNRIYWASTVENPSVHPIFEKPNEDELKADPFPPIEIQQDQKQSKLKSLIMQKNIGKKDAGGLTLPKITVGGRRNSSLNDLRGGGLKNYRISIVDDEALAENTSRRRDSTAQQGQMSSVLRRPEINPNMGSNYQLSPISKNSASRSKLAGSHIVLNVKRSESKLSASKLSK